MRMDCEQFEQAVRQHQRMVYNLALHALRERTLAEDLTQEVFLALLQHGDGITSAEHLTHWLRRVAARRCVDQIRRQRWRRHLPLDETRVEAGGDNRDPLETRRLERLLHALPARTRVALVLRYQEEIEPAEIGHLLGMPEAAVRKTLRHALTTLKLRLRPERARTNRRDEPLRRRVATGAELP